jgi:hypothetical protein
MSAPLACSLAPADHAQRTRQLAELATRALRDRQPIPGGVRLRFDPTATTRDELRRLAAAEAECCPFLHFDLTPGDETIVLDVTGPDEAQPLIAKLLA